MWTHTLHSKGRNIRSRTERHTLKNEDKAKKGTSTNLSDDRGCVRREKCPRVLLPCIAVQGPCGAFLRQARCDDMPDATNPFASSLAGTRIT